MSTLEPAGRPARRELLLFPCNGTALEALSCNDPSHTVLAFVDDDPGRRCPFPCMLDVLSRRAFSDWPEAAVLAVPGSPHSYLQRRGIIEGLGLNRLRFTRLIHPAAQVSPLASIGANVLIMAGVVVTSNAVIGDHVCLLPNTVVHHDVVIGAWSLVGSNVTLAGGVRVGENCYIASGTSIRNDLHIGAGSLVGLGSTVTRHVADGVRVAGNPARVLP